MPLINCEIILILTWSAYCVLASHTTRNQAPTLATTDTKLPIPVVILLINLNANLLL